MHLKPNRSGTANISELSEFISSKQNNSIINLTKLVVVISVILAVLMVVSR
jgi:hypothetical protein